MMKMLMRKMMITRPRSPIISEDKRSLSRLLPIKMTSATVCSTKGSIQSKLEGGAGQLKSSSPWKTNLSQPKVTRTRPRASSRRNPSLTACLTQKSTTIRVWARLSVQIKCSIHSVPKSSKMPFRLLLVFRTKLK